MRSGPFACLVADGFSDVLHELVAKSPDPTRWTDWEEVKSSTVRTIYRGSLPTSGVGSLDVHLKLFRAVRLSDRARDALTGSRSSREFRNLREAAARGLPCVEPLAAGTVAGSLGSQSFLLTSTEPGRPLPRGSDAPPAAAGALLRLAHDAGLHARDLHPGNLLLRPDGELRLLDLTSAAFSDPLNTAERGRALAFFCLDLDRNVRGARAFLTAYDATPSVIQSALRAGRRLRNRSVSAFGRRAFRACRTTRVERPHRLPRISLHVPAEELWPKAREAFASLASREPVKSGRRGAVYVLDDIVVKERTAAAARQLFENAYWLSYAGVQTPMPVAVETFQSRGRIAVQRLPASDLDAELRAGLSADQNALLACAKNLGAAVGRLHSFGLRNRDMKFENFIRDAATNTIHMVDLDGVRRQLPGDNRGRASDLGRLLAAFLHAGNPGGDAVIRAFLREYVRTCHKLLYPVPHRGHVLKHAEANARSWAEAHA